jgi:hypothetical protein
MPVKARCSIQVNDQLSVCGSIKVDDSALIDASLVVDSSFSARSFVRLESSLSVFGFAVVNSISGVSVTGGLLGGLWLYISMSISDYGDVFYQSHVYH